MRDRFDSRTTIKRLPQHLNIFPAKNTVHFCLPNSENQLAPHKCAPSIKLPKDPIQGFYSYPLKVSLFVLLFSAHPLVSALCLFFEKIINPNHISARKADFSVRKRLSDIADKWPHRLH
jgi:hypothetical protein